MAESAVIFQESDLHLRGRVVLDAARTGEARLRDGDGLSLLVIPEHRFRSAMSIVQATANLMSVEQMLDTAPEQWSVRDYGDWTWLRVFDSEDLTEFVHEMRTALLVAAREGSDKPVAETLERWQLTAQQLADPVRRSILLGVPPLSEEDFVEVARPE